LAVFEITKIRANDGLFDQLYLQKQFYAAVGATKVPEK